MGQSIDHVMWPFATLVHSSCSPLTSTSIVASQLWIYVGSMIFSFMFEYFYFCSDISMRSTVSQPACPPAITIDWEINDLWGPLASNWPVYWFGCCLALQRIGQHQSETINYYLLFAYLKQRVKICWDLNIYHNFRVSVFAMFGILISVWPYTIHAYE